MEPLHQTTAFIEHRDHIAIIRLNRPRKRNAMNFEMWERIADLVRECERDERIKVVLFSGVDTTAFSAGADISEFEAVHRSRMQARRYNQNIMATERAIMDCFKPTIAMIHGVCVGGGCEIALACDFRFAARNSIFGITPAKLGIAYNLPGTKNLVDLVGPSHAKDILYSGRLLDAAESHRIGLINQVYANEELEEKTIAYADLLSANAPNSICGAKRIIRAILDGETATTEEADNIVEEAFTSDHFREGIQAFMEKRKPRFQ